ncbi:hypothetical protein SRHO_G00103770 [Serrasalmus rhombeus]
MGRARDVVRIGLRSDPTLVARENPDVIYNILLQYFSKTSSCLPLADFYSTLPRQKENPVDYWIHVNKAADLAVEGLHRQGRGMENMAEEITRMFIKHCPDPELAYMFKCKPIHEWNAKQIQERIDEYQSEKRPITCVSNAAHLCHKATVTHVEDSDATLNGRMVAKSSNYANNTGESIVVMSQQYSSQSDAMLNRMMTMLEQVLEKVQRKDVETSHLHEGRRSWRKNNMMVCSVCGGKDHSTKSHFISYENSRIEVKEALKLVGLSDLDLEACDVSETWKEKLADLVLKYEDIFSHHHLDCGEAKGFVHRIHLVDDKPFRLPFRRVPPAEYQKLKRILDEMEEREIIRKSTSEYASPLVLVWKKNGDLRVCTDFRWLNKQTLKDAHPLPHQADA